MSQLIPINGPPQAFSHPGPYVFGPGFPKHFVSRYINVIL
jgi:hypothetical protein